MTETNETINRRKSVERLLEEARVEGASITDGQIASHLGVSAKTIQRDRQWLKERGRIVVHPKMSMDSAAILHDQTLNTVELIDGGLRRLNSELIDLHNRMGFEGDDCPCCGCKALDMNALLLTAKFKGEDSFNNQVVTRGKLLGELIETQVITVQQRDNDVTVMMQGIAAIRSIEIQDLLKGETFTLPDGSINVETVTAALTRKIYSAFVDASARRANRLKRPGEIIEAAYHEEDL